jgi:lipoate-protein ligase A
MQQPFPPTNSDWLIEEDFDQTGAHHMERDEALARERVENSSLPNVLRLYSWQPWAVSIGYQQSLDAVDLEACHAKGIDVVRRPTGGRAVLHANELTYAVIARAEPGSGIYAMHNKIIEALIESMAPLGPQYELLKLTPRSTTKNFGETYSQGTLTNAACFMSSARHEVTYLGKKVIGSAQRRFGDVTLQHGSILLTEDHLLLSDLLVLSDLSRQTLAESLKRETTTLSDLFQRPISIEEAAECVRNGFVENYLSEREVLSAIQL